MAWYSKRNRIIVLCVLGAAFIAYWAYVIHVPAWRMDREVISQRDAAKRKAEAEWIRKTADVVDVYPLRWPAREGARALSLSLPAVDLGAWVGSHPKVEETSAGPLSVRMRLPFPDVGLVTLDLHREPAGSRGTGGVVQPVLARGGERPGVLGIDCREAKPVLGEASAAGAPVPCYAVEWKERVFAKTFHLETLEVRLPSGMRASECVMEFPYAGRHASLRVEQPCRSARAYAALRDSYALLALREADAATAPSNEVRLERAAAATRACVRTAAEERERRAKGVVRFDPRASDLCAYAAHLTYPLLKAAPLQAATLMSEAMVPNIGRTERWDAYYLDEIIAALARAGAGDSAAAVWAHIARMQAPRPLAVAPPRYQSIAALMGASSPPPTEDPQRAPDDAEAPWRKSLSALVAIAERLPADSPLALKARFAVCKQRIEQRIEGVDLKHCGDSLLEAWVARVAAGGKFAEFTHGEPELATMVPRFFLRYGHESGDFQGALPGTRRAVALARERLPAEYATFLQNMAEAEQVIAGKAGR